MQPPKDPSPPGIDFFCPVKELFLSLEKIQSGSALPENVIADINPFQHQPSNLPEDVWFFVRPGENARTNFGVWKIKGEFCGLFSNQFITGCQTTFEYYEGQAPHALKTDWLMQKYWIIQKKIGENCKTKEASSLFRVFLGGEVRQNHTLSQQSVSPTENGPGTFGSTSNSQVLKRNPDNHDHLILQASKEDAADELRVERQISEIHRQHLEDVDESDYLSGGDFLELRDLDIPPSPSSSSENSSCLTMSSDACFDSLDLFQDIEHAISLDLVHRDAACKSTTAAPLRINEGVVLPSSSVLSDEIAEVKSSTQRNQNKQQVNNRGGLSTDSSNSSASASTSSHSATDGDMKARDKRMKKRLSHYYLYFKFCCWS